MKCNICPRKCNVDRTSKHGFCLANEKVVINKVMFHKFEEPVISCAKKTKGSGAIFFSGCNMRCVFCQNYPISHKLTGKAYSTEQLVKIFKLLEEKGANNINLVTPTHFSKQIISALKIYKPKIPIVWNSNGYECTKTIKKLKGLVDVFLLDLKYSSDDLALKYSKAANYVKNARAVAKLAKKLQPNDVVKNGIMQKGVIIRLLVLPTHSSDAISTLDFVCKQLGKNTIVSIMSQYEPMYDAKNYPEINRRLTKLEYKRVVNHAVELGMLNCFTQDTTSANTKYTPKFKT